MSYTNGLDKPKNYFDTLTYTGDGNTNLEVNGLNFTPSYIWIKGRDTAHPHTNIDSVRGGNKYLKSNETGAEETNPTYGWIDSFDSDGFTTQTGSNSNQWNVNKNGETYVAWNWKAGTSFTNDASATGIGSIDSTGSVNQDAGFSIVSYTGTGSTGTVAHGLGATPSMMIFKERADDAHGWITYHHKNTSAPATEFLLLNTTQATEDYADYFNDTAPTSSVFTIDTAGDINGSSDTYIAYCFAEKQGYSKFGSYTGNGSSTDNSFIYTGFKVGWLMIKKTSGTSNWTIWDSVRQSNEINKPLWGDLNSAEAAQSTVKLDLLSNGFKIRGNGSNVGSSGGSYIYMAFASNPLVTSTGVPATAR